MLPERNSRIEGLCGRRKHLFRCDLSSCSESAEIWYADSFCVKKCPRVFLPQSKSYNVWIRTEGERGAFSCNLVDIFMLSWTKKQGHFLTQIESACQISADSEQLEKLVLTPPFHGALQLEHCLYCIWDRTRATCGQQHLGHVHTWFSSTSAWAPAQNGAVFRHWVPKI